MTDIALLLLLLVVIVVIYGVVLLFGKSDSTFTSTSRAGLSDPTGRARTGDGDRGRPDDYAYHDDADGDGGDGGDGD